MRRGTPGAIQLGYHLQTLRTSADLSMREVARRIGAPAATVSQIEKGERALKEPKIPIWAKALNVHEPYLRQLWVAANSVPVPPITRNRGKSSTAKELEKTISELNGSERERVLGYIAAIIEDRDNHG